jgi:iron(III) transport system ATP-binding protein
MPADSRGVAVSIEGAVKRFDGRTVLDGVSLTVAPGEFFTLLGPSGCGKTTLLRAIAGYHPLDGGLIRFGGEDVTARPAWERHVGFVFQNYALWPDKSVFENVAYGLRVRKRPEAEVQARVAKALALVRLSGVEGKAPGALSGGMQQRAALARALVVDPPVLLFDEPLSNLDALLRVQLRRDIRAIQRDLGTTAVYVTHDQEEALEISDRIAVMHEGRLAQVGAPDAIYERPANAVVAQFVGTANLLPGERRGDSFALAASGALPLALVDNGGTLGERQAATLMLRPEWLQPGEHGMATARITARFYTGAHSRYALAMADGTTLTMDTHRPLPLGADVGVVATRGWLLPESTGEVVSITETLEAVPA